MHALPSDTRLGRLRDRARGVPGRLGRQPFMYYAVQGLTFAILVLAANTSYQGFPRLVGDPRPRPLLPAPVRQPRRPARLLERDRRPRRRSPSLLIWAFNADVNALIHLYVIGVFTAFTLSQAGMVRYWLRHADAAAGAGRR